MLIPPNSKSRLWPKISYFAIFDGHSGNSCSNFLKENLLNYIIENKNFPIDIKLSITQAFEKAEKEFLNKYYNSKNDESGSCANIILIVDSKIYCANIGDSRSILSLDNGSKIKPLSIDHKPNNPSEFERIIKLGGRVYYDDSNDELDLDKVTYIDKEYEFDKFIADKKGVFRVYPFNIAVCRTIGDFNYKNSSIQNANPSIISPVPDILFIDGVINHEFIVMGCDGIYDELNNSQIINCCNYAINEICKKENCLEDMNHVVKNCCDMIIKYALHCNSSDNLSCIVIMLEGGEKYIKTLITKNKLKSKTVKKLSI